MYVNCIFCRSHLSSNDLVEHFPVGRRLAFDAAKGRLWVVCRRCQRWNLTPLEERWEAIEECERIFRATRTRFSTDEIGLAKTREGLQLVRIGNPMRPEFAAWRYGDQFRSRRTKTILLGAGAVVGGVAGLALALPALATIGIGATVAAQIPQALRSMRDRRIIARVPTGRQTLQKFIDVRHAHLKEAQFYRSEAGNEVRLRLNSDQGAWTLSGDSAIIALQHVLPAVNAAGASASVVRNAVAALQLADDPMKFVLLASNARVNADIKLSSLTKAATLALEMAVNEENERVAIAGELAALEAAWKDAEEIASIADNLLVPEWIHKFISSSRGTRALPRNQSDDT